MSQFPAQQAVSPADALRRQAAQLLSSGRLDEGTALLEQALAAQPSADIHNDLGRAF